MHARPVIAPASWLLAALLVVRCGPGGLPSGAASPAASPASSAAVPSPAAVQTLPPSASPPGSVVASLPVPATPGPSAEAASGPPSAAISVLAGPTIAGALGSYTWAGAGSDAPWLVPAAADAVRGSGPYAVGFSPPGVIASWTAAWAPVVAGRPGERAGFEQGVGRPVLFRGPTRNGDWTMQVDVRFASGGHCAWYWRLRGGG